MNSKNQIFLQAMIGVFLCLVVLSIFSAFSPQHAYADDIPHVEIRVPDNNVYLGATATPDVQHNLGSGASITYKWYEVISPEPPVELVLLPNDTGTIVSSVPMQLLFAVEVRMGNVFASDEIYLAILPDGYEIRYMDSAGTVQYNAGNPSFGVDSAEKHRIFDGATYLWGTEEIFLGWSLTQGGTTVDYVAEQEYNFTSGVHYLYLVSVSKIDPPTVEIDIDGPFDTPDLCDGQPYYFIEATPAHASVVSYQYQWFRYDRDKQIYVALSGGNAVSPASVAGLYAVEVTASVSGYSAKKFVEGIAVGGGEAPQIYTVNYYDHTGEILLRSVKIWAGDGHNILSLLDFSQEPQLSAHLTKVGYEFIGWHTLRGNVAEYIDGNLSVDGDITLYAILQLRPPSAADGGVDNIAGSDGLGQQYRKEGYALTLTNLYHALLNDPTNPVAVHYEWYFSPEEEGSYLPIADADQSYLTVCTDADNGYYKLYVYVRDANMLESKPLVIEGIYVKIIMPPTVTISFWQDINTRISMITQNKGEDFILPEVNFQKRGYTVAGWRLRATGEVLKTGDTIIALQENLVFEVVLELLPPVLATEIEDIYYEYKEVLLARLLIADVDEIDGFIYTYQWYKMDGNGEYMLIPDASYNVLSLNKVSDSGKYRVTVTVTDGTQTSFLQSREITVTISFTPADKDNLLWLWITLGILGGLLLMGGGVFLILFRKKKKTIGLGDSSEITSEEDVKEEIEREEE